MKRQIIQILKHPILQSVNIDLPASKSISNRALIINRFADGSGTIHNLSMARDTQTMQRLLNSPDNELDVLDAGTTMRFLTAYLTITNQHKVLTGTTRMCERPIKILVDALRKIGGNIEYLKNDGYPPLDIRGFEGQKSTHITIRGDVSSQYISALLMIAPMLPEGLTLELTGEIGSRPYITMTLNLMEQFGVTTQWEDNNRIYIAPQPYQPTEVTIEPDWSGASYWYAFLALSDSQKLHLNKLTDFSLQGDRVIAEIMKPLGVSTDFTPDGAVLTKQSHDTSVSFDFKQCPDLGQTVAVVCAAKGIHCTMMGLESLKIKETDRIKGLQNELAKIGAQLNEKDGVWELIPSESLPDHVEIETYDDHRMAMAFAPLSTLMNVDIENPAVVNKSFPNFWEEMNKAGFIINTVKNPEN